ncbi:restriction endonuclease subunit S [Thiomicrorhabdus sp. HH1]|uniref:Restriction endonuclease subunit S n=1 Tax=Thiomicrorhabdus heinhorstiae TaxID=2748010 RepID=A0ABS0BZ22_9GAMM|nr:restriction endonuclease subunit S [Thiomicrorhabdus heinhorstiae]
MSVNNLITGHLDTWTQAIETKSTAGRGSGNKLNLVGIQKLRELILEMAVRGLLVPQDPNDEPASVLLEKIAAEKAQLIKDKKIKKSKALPEIAEDEKPFDLPNGWEFKRLPDIYFNISPSGKKLKTSDILEEGKFPVVDQGQNYISGYFDDESLLIHIPRKVVIFGDHTTNLKLIDFDFIAGADGTKIMCPIVIDEQYFYRFLTSLTLENRGYGRHFKILNDNLISIPPLEEQKRIVTKVDELMALCDQLESETLNHIDIHQTLVSTLLGNLVNPENTANFQDAWALIAENFDVLFTTENSIDQLKQTILQLAVMGKLVPQNPNDEPASELLKKIATEKTQLIKDGKLKKSKPLPEITEAEKPFDLPNGWEWVKLNEIISMMDAGWSPACPPEPSPDNETWGVLKTTSVQILQFLPEENKLLPSNKEPRPQYEVKSGDILVTRAGPWNRVGISCLVKETRPKLMTSDKLIRFHLVDVGMSEEYMVLALQAGVTAEYLESCKSGMASSQVNISQDKLKAAPIPLPALEEQKLIVTKVNELIALCDQLKTQLQTAQQTQIHLAQSIAQEALA